MQSCGTSVANGLPQLALTPAAPPVGARAAAAAAAGGAAGAAPCERMSLPQPQPCGCITHSTSQATMPALAPAAPPPSADAGVLGHRAAPCSVPLLSSALAAALSGSFEAPAQQLAQQGWVLTAEPIPSGSGSAAGVAAAPAARPAGAGEVESLRQQVAAQHREQQRQLAYIQVCRRACGCKWRCVSAGTPELAGACCRRV